MPVLFWQHIKTGLCKNNKGKTERFPFIGPQKYRKI